MTSDKGDKGRKRAVKACDGCRAKKIKCNDHVPCDACEARDVQCQFGLPIGNETKSTTTARASQLQVNNDILVKALRATWEKYAKPTLGLENEPTPSTDEIVRLLGVPDERVLHHLSVADVDLDNLEDCSSPGSECSVSKSRSDSNQTDGIQTNGHAEVPTACDMDLDSDAFKPQMGSPEGYMLFSGMSPSNSQRLDSYLPITPSSQLSQQSSYHQPHPHFASEYVSPGTGMYRTNRPMEKLNMPKPSPAMAFHMMASHMYPDYNRHLHRDMVHSNSESYNFDGYWPGP